MEEGNKKEEVEKKIIYTTISVDEYCFKFIQEIRKKLEEKYKNDSPKRVITSSDVIKELEKKYKQKQK